MSDLSAILPTPDARSPYRAHALAGALRLPAAAVLAIASVLLLACGGGDSAPEPEGASISVGSEPEARVTTTSSGYGPWAREVCDVLERSLVQLQTVSVSSDDLGAFLRTAATNAEELAEDLGDIEAAPGTDAFMAQTIAAFRAVVPLLLETGQAIGAAGPDATLESLRREVAARETRINAELTKVYRSARSDLPLEAQRALSQSLPCGLVGRP